MQTHHAPDRGLKALFRRSILQHRPGKWKLWAGLVFLAMACLSVRADPPPNDLCSGAMIIPPPGIGPSIAPPVDITQATSVGDPTMLPGCQMLVTQSVWYVFTPTNLAFYTVSSCSPLTTVEDTVLAIYTNAVGCSDPTQFGLIACADDTGGDCYQKASITTELQSGVSYYILLWRYAGTAIIPENTHVQLYISKTPPPGNDTCANAQPLTLNMPVQGTTLAANNDYELDDSACYTGLGQKPTITAGRDVVYSFVAPAAGTYSMKVYNYNSDPNELVIYAASECPSGYVAPQPVTGCLAAANRVIAGTAEELFCLPLAEGQLIYVFVDEETLTGGSTFNIEVTPCQQESEANNATATASALSCGIEGSLSSSSDSDYYALGQFPTGSRAFAMLDGSAGATTFFSMDLVTATNLLETDRDKGDNDLGYGKYSANIAGTILPDIPTYLRIFTTKSGTQVPYEPYRLYAVVQPPIENATPENPEPNDNYWDATSASNNYFGGTLSSSSDVDIFSFTASAGDLVFLSLDCDPLRNNTPMNGKMELLDPDGKMLVMVDDENSISSTNGLLSSPGEALVYRVADDGTYLVQVSISPNATGPVSSGDYLLSISKNGYTGVGSNTPPVITSLSIADVNEGQPALLTGSVVDPDTGEAFNITVDWGDGSNTVSNLLGVCNFSLPHVYRNNLPGGPPFGSYPISVSLSDKAGATATNATSVVVSNVAPGVNLQLVSSSIPENGYAILNATVLDSGSLDEHVVTIDWNDGSLLSVTNLPAGQTNFTMMHQYLDDGVSGTAGDIYSVIAVVSDSDSATGTNKVSLIVNNVAPVLSGATVTTPVLPGQLLTLHGNISDVGTLDSFAVEVRWGDGSIETNFLSSGTSQFNVQHTYQLAGTNLTVQVTLRDDDGGQTTTNLALVIMSVVEPQLSLGWGNSLSLSVRGSVGVSYHIQATTNLTNWEIFTNLTIGPSGGAEVALPFTPDEPQRFYRALYQ